MPDGKAQTRRSYPWYKTFSRLHRDYDYLGLSLEQRAVLRALMDVANEQEPRGSFQAGNLTALACHTADGRVDLLQSVLDYCMTTWTHDDGVPFIVIEDSVGRFTSWQRHQRPPSDEPEATRERKRNQRDKVQQSQACHEHVTSMSRAHIAPSHDPVEVEVDTEIDTDKDVVVEGSRPTLLVVPPSQGAPETATTPDAHEEMIREVCRRIGITPTSLSGEAIRTYCKATPHVSHLAEASKAWSTTANWPNMSVEQRIKLVLNYWEVIESRAKEREAKTLPAKPRSTPRPRRIEPTIEELEEERRRAAIPIHPPKGATA